MEWRISPKVQEILARAGDFQGISREEALTLLGLDLDSEETYAVTATANRLSRHLVSRMRFRSRLQEPITGLPDTRMGIISTGFSFEATSR